MPHRCFDLAFFDMRKAVPPTSFSAEVTAQAIEIAEAREAAADDADDADAARIEKLEAEQAAAKAAGAEGAGLSADAGDDA